VLLRSALFLAALFWLASPQPDARKIAAALQSRYQHARPLKAVFFQSYSDGKGALSAESGTVYFSRPGRMRWEYESPEKKLFLVDGVNVWFYVPADHTATRAKLNESSDWRTPIALLAGKADLSKLCSNLEIAGASALPPPAPPPADTVLRCTLRKSPASETIREVLFQIDPDSFLTRIVVREAGNATTDYRFANWQQNLPVPESQFHFQPPPGVAVVSEQALADSLR
jgi:outer membrane lipoprotein carrier protein